jgi:two-component system response regulator DctR
VHDQLIARHCRMPVIFLSGHGDIPMAVRAVNNGALDFIEKPFDPDGLLRRLSKALGLEADRHQSQQAQSQLRTVILGLSDRELPVMRMVALGKLNKVIANELGISMRTVEVHRAKVYEKLGVRSGAEVATLLVQFESV